MDKIYFSLDLNSTWRKMYDTYEFYSNKYSLHEIFAIIHLKTVLVNCEILLLLLKENVKSLS